MAGTLTSQRTWSLFASTWSVEKLAQWGLPIYVHGWGASTQVQLLAVPTPLQATSSGPMGLLATIIKLNWKLLQADRRCVCVELGIKEAASQSRAVTLPT